MPAYSSDVNMVRITNKKFLKIAKECKPRLYRTIVYPQNIVEISKDEEKIPLVREIDTVEHMPDYHLKKGERLIIDFGHHQVGYVTLKLSSFGSPQDAPAYIRLKFGEIAAEMIEQSSDYKGWISKGWIQEEYVHIDVLPALLELPRRYAFRYLAIEVIDTSMKWQLVVNDVKCQSVSSVQMENIVPLNFNDKLICQIDEVSLRTLKNCMQDVFEDGPKRDRRLWLGDLRLQALTNYETFKNYTLVKRCLYLFASQTKDNGQVGACIFTEPSVIVDDTFLRDYSMMFGVVLLEYYLASGDRNTLEELSKCAYLQMEIAKAEFDSRNCLIVGEGFWGFIDWTEGLDKQAAMQGVYIYCAKYAKRIAEILGDQETAEKWKHEVDEKIEASIRYMRDEYTGLFVSGPQKQINYASQVWMILAGVVTAEEGAELLDKIKDLKTDKVMVSPYMNHYYVEAMIVCGKKQEALDYLKYYWGGMIANGADTFWELYNPLNPAETPYGACIANSYCHAWSCTPTYFLRKYYNKDAR